MWSRRADRGDVHGPGDGGATLYALIIGHAPYSDAERPPTLTTLVHRILNEPVPDLGPSAPAELQTVLERAMAKRPQDRYPTAHELAEAIDAALGRALAVRGAETVVVERNTTPVGAGAPAAERERAGRDMRKLAAAGGERAAWCSAPV